MSDSIMLKKITQADLNQQYFVNLPAPNDMSIFSNTQKLNISDQFSMTHSQQLNFTTENARHKFKKMNDSFSSNEGVRALGEV